MAMDKIRINQVLSILGQQPLCPYYNRSTHDCGNPRSEYYETQAISKMECKLDLLSGAETYYYYSWKCKIKFEACELYKLLGK